MGQNEQTPHSIRENTFLQFGDVAQRMDIKDVSPYSFERCTVPVQMKKGGQTQIYDGQTVLEILIQVAKFTLPKILNVRFFRFWLWRNAIVGWTKVD